MKNMLTCAVMLVGVTGCALRPIPNDVTREDTFHIVQKIRCEAKLAVKQKLENQLLNSKNHGSRRYGERLKTGDLRVRQFIADYDRNSMIVDDESRRRINAYRDTAIAYKFTFDMAVNNNAVVNTSFRDPFTNGVFGIALHGGTERLRQNQRVFTVADTFDEILMDSSIDASIDGCKPSAMKDRDWQYPITGNLGLDEIIDTFLAIAQNAQYAEDKTVPSFIDTIIFTTRYYGDIEPKVTINEKTIGGLDLREASVNADADRVDTHQVAISLVLPVLPVTPVTAKPPTEQRRRAATARSTKQQAIENIQTQEFLGTQTEILRRLGQPR